MTVMTRREVQGREVAERVNRVTGVPTDWLLWDGIAVPPSGTGILVNATHLGAAPEKEAVPVDWSGIASGTTAVDVITNPRFTPFLETARSNGCVVVDGVEMLVQLAMQIFEQWTGIVPEEAVFQRAVAAALGEG
jgi:shikimate dehydrogenase